MKGEPPDMKISTIGLDIARNVFQVHGVNESGEVVEVVPENRTSV